MIIQKNGLTYFQFSHIAETTRVRHGVFTRKGGQSQGPYQSLNICETIGDLPAHVMKNRRAICRCLDADSLVCVQQVHGSGIKIVKQNAAPGVGDALITNQPDVFLTIQVADCQPVLLVDPIRRVIANVHSGWRGSIQNIIGKTVQTMTEKFSCHPPDILAGIGPSLGPCCAEFIHYRNELPRSFWQYKDADNHFNFWAISHHQLLESGILERHIQISGLCTRCRPDLFFSYRKAKVTGRFASVIGMASY